MRLVTFELEDPRPELVDQDLLLVDILLHYLNSFQLRYGVVRSFSFLQDLSPEGYLQFFFLFLLRGSQDLVFRDFLLDFDDLVFGDDQLSV